MCTIMSGCILYFLRTLTSLSLFTESKAFAKSIDIRNNVALFYTIV